LKPTCNTDIKFRCFVAKFQENGSKQGNIIFHLIRFMYQNFFERANWIIDRRIFNGKWKNCKKRCCSI